MMTSRAEHRIVLRQDNADFRLTEYGRRVGLVSNKRYNLYKKRKAYLEKAEELLNTPIKPKQLEKLLTDKGFSSPSKAYSLADLIRMGFALSEISYLMPSLLEIPLRVLQTAEINAKYHGYILKEQEQIEKAKKLEEKKLSPDIDYSKILGLRLEARQKLNKIKPSSLGQAGRISGVSPADIAVLMVYLSK